MSIQHALLSLLDEGPCFGLRLREQFEAWTGEVWPLNVGQVYTTLQRLERDGYVTADEAGDSNQRFYSLTESGHDELRRWLTSATGAGAPPRQELVIKVLMSLLVADVDTNGVIQVHRRALMEELQAFTRAKAAASEDDLAAALVLDAQIFRVEAMIRWLDLCEERITRGARLRPPEGPEAGRNPTTRVGSDHRHVVAADGVWR